MEQSLILELISGVQLKEPGHTRAIYTVSRHTKLQKGREFSDC